MSVSVVWGVSGCDPRESTRLEQVPLPHVRVAEVQRVAPAPRSRHLVPLQPFRSARLAPRSGGEVVRLQVDEEQEVRPGQVLVRFAASDPKGGLMSAEAAIARIDESLRDNERELATARRLASEGAETERQVERLETERAVMEAQRVEAKGQLLRAKDRVGATSILAPFGGVVIAVETEVGEYLPPGTTAVRLAQLDPIALEVPLTQSEVRRFDAQGLKFEVEAHGEVFVPELEWLSSEADPSTSTFTARLLVPNEPRRFRAGELVEVRVLAAEQPSVLAVPATSIRWAAQQAYVLRVDPSDHVERVDIVVGADVQGRVTVEGALAEGDRVVSSGPAALLPGDIVETVGAAVDTLAQGPR